MAVYGVFADEETICDRLVVEAGRDETENLDLSWRKALPGFGAGRPGSVRGEGAENSTRASQGKARPERRQFRDGALDLVDCARATSEGRP